MLITLNYAAAGPGRCEDPDFQHAARTYVEAQLPRCVPFRVAIAEGDIREGAFLRAPDDPAPAGDYHFCLHAFGDTENDVYWLQARYDALCRAFVRESRHEFFSLGAGIGSPPTAEWLDWFRHATRCPACGVFPDMTNEYLPCSLCGYADYRHDDPEEVRLRFLQDPASHELVTAVAHLLSVLDAETIIWRRSYLLCRIRQTLFQPGAALRALPWIG